MRKKYLPEGHAWWLRDQRGRIVPGWEEGGFSCLDFHNPEFRRQVARQAKAAVASGVVDGVMLDWWSDDAGRLALVKEVREAIGDGALIICECQRPHDAADGPFHQRVLHGVYHEQDTPRLEEDRRYAGLGLRRTSSALGSTAWKHGFPSLGTTSI